MAILRKLFDVTLFITLVFNMSYVAAATIYTTTDNGDKLGTIDSVTGQGTVVGPFGQSGCFSLAFDRNGTMFVACGNTLYKGDTSTGALTIVGTTPGINYGMEFDSTGQLWGTSSDSLYKIDKTNGTTTLVGSVSPASGIMDLAFGAGGVLYLVDGANKLYSVNTTTGATTLIGTGPMSNMIMGLMADSSGAMYAISYTNPGILYSVNTTTAALTVVGTDTLLNFPHGGSFFVAAAPQTPAAIPTLSEWAMIFLASLMAMFGIRRMRRNK